MRNVLGILLILALLWSCNKTAKTFENQEGEALVFQSPKMPSTLPLFPKADAAVKTWEAFITFDKSMQVLYTAQNTEETILAIVDLIEKEKLLARSDYPRQFNTLLVKSRQQVVKTYLHKVKFGLLENQPVTTPTVEMLQAYNALRRQFNRIVSNPLDSTLLAV